MVINRIGLNRWCMGAQQGIEGSLEGLDVDGFGDVTVESGGLGPGLIALHGMGGQDQNRYGSDLRIVAEQPDRGQPVHARQWVGKILFPRQRQSPAGCIHSLFSISCHDPYLR